MEGDKNFVNLRRSFPINHPLKPPFIRRIQVIGMGVIRQ